MEAVPMMTTAFKSILSHGGASSSSDSSSSSSSSDTPTEIGVGFENGLDVLNASSSTTATADSIGDGDAGGQGKQLRRRSRRESTVQELVNHFESRNGDAGFMPVPPPPPQPQQPCGDEPPSSLLSSRNNNNTANLSMSVSPSTETDGSCNSPVSHFMGTPPTPPPRTKLPPSPPRLSGELRSTTTVVMANPEEDRSSSSAARWIECRTDYGATYFFNNATGESAWEEPKSFRQMMTTEAAVPSSAADLPAHTTATAVGVASAGSPSSRSPSMSPTDARNQRGESALHLAASLCFLNGMKLLVENGADVSAQDESGRTPLHAAAHTPAPGSPACCRFLVESGARIDALDDDACTPLHVAASVGNHDGLVALLKAGGGDSIDGDGHGTPSPMKRAGGEGVLQEIAATPNKDGNTALHLAATNGHLACMQTLVLWGTPQAAQQPQPSHSSPPTFKPPLHPTTPTKYGDAGSSACGSSASSADRQRADNDGGESPSSARSGGSGRHHRHKRRHKRDRNREKDRNRDRDRAVDEREGDRVREKRGEESDTNANAETKSATADAIPSSDESPGVHEPTSPVPLAQPASPAPPLSLASAEGAVRETQEMFETVDSLMADVQAQARAFEEQWRNGAGNGDTAAAVVDDSAADKDTPEGRSHEREFDNAFGEPLTAEEASRLMEWGATDYGDLSGDANVGNGNGGGGEGVGEDSGYGDGDDDGNGGGNIGDDVAAVAETVFGDWVECEEDGQVYYYNTVTGDSAWELPKHASTAKEGSGFGEYDDRRQEDDGVEEMKGGATDPPQQTGGGDDPSGSPYDDEDQDERTLRIWNRFFENAIHKNGSGADGESANVEPESAFEASPNDVLAAVEAVLGGRTSELEALLLEARIEVNMTADEQTGRTLLHMACAAGDGIGNGSGTDTLALLCDYGADLDLPDSFGNTPLHTCAAMGFRTPLVFLLESAATCTLANDQGDTPLHLAAWHANLACVEKLLEYGPAALSSRNLFGETPFTNVIKRSPLFVDNTNPPRALLQTVSFLRAVIDEERTAAERDQTAHQTHMEAAGVDVRFMDDLLSGTAQLESPDRPSRRLRNPGGSDSGRGDVDGRLTDPPDEGRAAPKLASPVRPTFYHNPSGFGEPGKAPGSPPTGSGADDASARSRRRLASSSSNGGPAARWPSLDVAALATELPSATIHPGNDLTIATAAAGVASSAKPEHPVDDNDPGSDEKNGMWGVLRGWFSGDKAVGGSQGVDGESQPAASESFSYDDSRKRWVFRDSEGNEIEEDVSGIAASMPPTDGALSTGNGGGTLSPLSSIEQALSHNLLQPPPGVADDLRAKTPRRGRNGAAAASPPTASLDMPEDVQQALAAAKQAAKLSTG